MDPIERRDLVPPRELTRAFFRATQPHLSHERFERKWQKGFESPLRFFRAFPQAYYLDLTQVPVEHVPGHEDLCFGDLHPENFGFLVFGGVPHYVFNDLDDAGRAEVGLDALRWFVAHRLWDGDEKATFALIDHYRDVMRDPRIAVAIDPALAPDPVRLRSKQLAKLVDGRSLVRSARTLLADADAGERAIVEEAFRASAPLDGLRLLDVAERERDHGGSGGLRRFWALVEDREGALDVLELKELAKPSTAWGHWHTMLEDRIAVVRDRVWRGLPVQDHFTVVLGRSEFLVRSRTTRASLDLEGLSGRARREVLKVQVGIMACHHRASFAPEEMQPLDDWLQESTRVVAERWLDVYERLVR
jgi:hypothetical protein